MMNETVSWILPQDKMPRADNMVLLALTDGTVCEGLWNDLEKAWMYGDECAIYEDDDFGIGVHYWAVMPKGPSRKKGTKVPHPANFNRRRK